MNVRSLVLPVLLATAPLAAAQTHLALGDMVHNGDTNQVRVMPEVGFTSTPYTSIAHDRILWDPDNPDSFYVATGGLGTTGGLARMDFVGGGEVEHTTLVGSGIFSSPRDIEFDQSGDLVLFVNENLRRYDVDTGVLSSITTGNQPWNSMNGGAVDPLTGDIYVCTNSGKIWRRGTNGSVSLFTTVSGSGQSGNSVFVRDLEIDSVAFPHHYMYYSMQSSMRRIDLNDPAKTEEVLYDYGLPAGLNVDPRCFTFDTHGDIVVRNGGYHVYRFDNAPVWPAGGTSPTYLGEVVFPSNAVGGDIAIVGGTASEPFRLDIHPIPGGGGYFEIQNVPEPVGFGWLLLSASTFLPEGSGPLFGLMPDGLTTAILSLPQAPASIAFVDVPPPSFSLPAPLFTPFIGTAWDGVIVSFAPDGTFLGKSNVSRVFWE